MTDESRKPPDVEVVEEKVEDRAVRHVIDLERQLGRDAPATAARRCSSRRACHSR